MLSLVIPCYNEAPGLPALVERCRALTTAADAEIILVDNGSTDATKDVLKSLLARESRCRAIRVEPNRGYGGGILAGLREARGHILGWTHADLQTDPLDAARGLAFFTGKEQSFVKGRRYGRPASDQLFTIAMSAFESLLLCKPLWDINAQPTLLPRAFFESWEDPPTDFSLDLFAYYHARRVGLAVRRYPVRFAPRGHGTSHWNVNWGAKWKFIRRTVSFSFELRKRLYR